ncbi:MAG: hypothetical protein ABW252_08615 [Polyangiales bacterium]
MTWARAEHVDCATAPYFHNGSVPTLDAVLNPALALRSLGARATRRSTTSSASVGRSPRRRARAAIPPRTSPRTQRVRHHRTCICGRPWRRRPGAVLAYLQTL